MDPEQLHFPATLRNRQVILETMLAWLGPEQLKQSPYRVLEIASGSGEHSVHLAPGLAEVQPRLRWLSTDLKPEHVASSQAWQRACPVDCFEPPARLDVLDLKGSALAKSPSFDLIYCANMIHIAPWSCTLGFFAVAQALLAPRGRIFLYGPFMRDGVHTSASNASFSQGLRNQNPEWGVRELEKVESVAADHGFERCELASMPANNLSLLFRPQNDAETST